MASEQVVVRTQAGRQVGEAPVWKSLSTSTSSTYAAFTSPRMAPKRIARSMTWPLCSLPSTCASDLAPPTTVPLTSSSASAKPAKTCPSATWSHASRARTASGLSSHSSGSEGSCRRPGPAGCFAPCRGPRLRGSRGLRWLRCLRSRGSRRLNITGATARTGATQGGLTIGATTRPGRVSAPPPSPAAAVAESRIRMAAAVICREGAADHTERSPRGAHRAHPPLCHVAVKSHQRRPPAAVQPWSARDRSRGRRRRRRRRRPHPRSARGPCRRAAAGGTRTRRQSSRRCRDSHTPSALRAYADTRRARVPAQGIRPQVEHDRGAAGHEPLHRGRPAALGYHEWHAQAADTEEGIARRRQVVTEARRIAACGARARGGRGQLLRHHVVAPLSARAPHPRMRPLRAPLRRPSRSYASSGRRAASTVRTLSRPFVSRTPGAPRAPFMTTGGAF